MGGVDRPGAKAGEAGVGKLVIDDLFRGDLKRSLRRDLRELYDFYLVEEDRARLAAMGRLRRALAASFWLLKCLIRRLAPGRRLLLIVALTAAFFSSVRLDFGNVVIGGDLHSLSFALVLVILMLELKDRLLAHDELAVAMPRWPSATRRSQRSGDPCRLTSKWCRAPDRSPPAESAPLISRPLCRARTSSRP